ncbi:DNA repair protein RecN [Zafaria sp. Z1313]|uniref:DNA repair protein RecN n=1 Tax=unclassified Zafaria TaxID=2828765 RepID=UPI002E76B8D3|nr:DNA repair protein RecN [Zafaria sp. J156]MEE1622535.1 DNA repair protein RecN [Zafaria sp. J156]
MIEEIRISDLGVITGASLPLGAGLSVVTGETGAGKTMVVTALGLLLGARADAGSVRHGARQAVAEASLRLPAGGSVVRRAEEAGALVDEDDDEAGLIISRTVGAEGRSKAAVGGRAAPVGLLAELGAELVVVHGQTDQLRLKEAAAQRGALDKFGGRELARAVEDYGTAFDRWRDVQAELGELTGRQRERLREAEALQLSLEEIDAVDPGPGEDEALKAESMKLTNLEGLRSAALTAQAAVSGDDYADAPAATVLVEAAQRSLEQAGGDDPELAALSGRLKEVGYLLADVSAELSSYAAGLDADGPGRLAEVEERRAALSVLVRKYAPGIDEVLEWAAQARARLGELQDDSGRIEALTAEEERLRAELAALGATLTGLRTSAAAELADRVTAELAALAMPDARFVVEVLPAAQAARHGADEVRMLLQPHAGSAPRPLGKGASGGELSRVMLAIEVVLAAVDPVPTFVFDEVDAGVGGKAAVQIGKRLAMLARHVQVIVVTHLPQVAAYADRHIRVIKSSDAAADGGAGFTASDVVLLDEPERIRELARMLAGQEESDTAQAHAGELLEEARQAVSALG